jgi:hypothetical protein
MASLYKILAGFGPRCFQRRREKIGFASVGFASDGHATPEDAFPERFRRHFSPPEFAPAVAPEVMSTAKQDYLVFRDHHHAVIGFDHAAQSRDSQNRLFRPTKCHGRPDDRIKHARQLFQPRPGRDALKAERHGGLIDHLAQRLSIAEGDVGKLPEDIPGV